MNCKIIANKMSHSSEALTVLLRIAWRAAHGDDAKTFPLHFKLGPSRAAWHLRWKNFESTVVLLVKESIISGHIAGINCTNFNEVFAALAAWGIAGRLRTRDVHKAATKAIYEVRERGDELIQALAAADQRRETRENRAFAKKVLVSMERESSEYKLRRIEIQEKAWNRKLKLAQTKLTRLRRRRAALLAAAKRRNQVNEPVS